MNVQRLVQMVFGQVFPTHQALHASVPMETDNGHQSLSRRMACRFDIEIQRTMAERLK